MSDLYVQYGCGFSAPPGWRNFDSSPTLRFERLPLLGRIYTRNDRRFPSAVSYGNIVKGLPLAEGSCAGIYCSHVLEHLALDEFDIALKNTFRYLRPGGTFRLVMPDLRKLAGDYVQDVSPTASHRFLEAAHLGRNHRSQGLLEFLKEWLGGSAHLWMWDEFSMQAALDKQGFSQIRRADFGDAEDSKFNAVEDRTRFEGCLAMQCRK